MQLHRTLDAWRAADPPRTSLCLGVFDGVHRGHQMLIDRARAHAADLGVASLVFTFSNHPLTVLAPPYAPPLLSSPEEKAALIAAHGVDHCLMLDFDPAFAAIPADVFIEEILARSCRGQSIVCGHDFRFGFGGRGDVQLLRLLGDRLGINVEILDDLSDGHTPVRSSRIRQHLLEGEIEVAARLLGRPYSLGATVVGGDQRGRQIGFPTANLKSPPERLVPHDGVYAVRVELENGRRYGGMLNIGTRPTFQTGHRTVEVHLFDFTGDLYGQSLTVRFLTRIREERRFDSIQSLVQQIKLDEIACRSVLGDTTG